MTGTSGSTAARVAVVTASARSLPALMCGVDDGVTSNITCAWPARRSVSAGVVPRYGMPVRGRAHDCFGSDISAGPRTVLDHERLTETLRQPLSQQARGNVRPAAGGLPDNDAHRPRWKGLRPRGPRDSRDSGSTRCQMQKLSAA